MRMSRDQAAVKIDWDGDTSLTLRDITRRVKRAGYSPIAMSIMTSPSGKGTHAILHVLPRPSSPFEVVALALLLGSDINREAMQLFRAAGFPHVKKFMRDAWNVLYEPHPHRMRHAKLKGLFDV